MLLESVVLFIGCSLVLVKSASFAVRSLTTVSRRLGFSEYFTAFFVAGLVSITPELFIGINAALLGTPAVGAGTIIGSNVADLTIVIGLVALIGRRMPMDKRTERSMLPFVVVTSLPVILMLDGSLSQADGLALIVAFFVYIINLSKSERLFSRRGKQKKQAIAQNLLIFVIAMTVLYLSAHAMVGIAVDISTALFVPTIIIGLFLVAIGTTLPETTLSLRAVMSKHKEVALGDILGNVAADSTLSLGIVALISPIVTEYSVFATSAVFMVFAAVLVVTLLKNGRKITREEAGVLFFLYFLFVLMELVR